MSDLGNPVADDRVELVDDEQVGIKYRLRKCGKCRLIVISLVILCVIGAAVALAVILTREPLICETKECYNISKVISNQLDKDVDPCEDFYSYACGGFFKTHHLSVNQSSVVGFTIVNDDNMEVLRQAMETAASNYSQSSSIVKTAKIYDTCVDTAAIERRGISPLENLIKQYGGWTVTGDIMNRSWTVAEKMGAVLRDLNVQTLLSVSVAIDLQDSSQHILSIGISSLGMSYEYYYEDSSQGEQIREAYKTYMKTIARLLGGGGWYSEQQMMHIYDFEWAIAEAANPNKVSDDLIESFRDDFRAGRSVNSGGKTLEDFCRDSNFDLEVMVKFLNTAFSDQGRVFSSFNTVYYPSSDAYLQFFKAIGKQYHNKSAANINDYIMWRVIDNYVMSMPSQFVQAKRQFQETIIGVREYKRWSHCLESMMEPMGMTLGRLYVDANFDESTKTTVKDMTSRLRTAFIDNLKSADWMDYDTKQAAKEKAQAIKEDIGYPPYIKNDTKLDAQYSMLVARNDYFANEVAMNKMIIQKNFVMLDQPVNKDLWMESPAEVNGYYSPQQNRIVFLAGILQSPFYRKLYPKYLNYGSLAMVIGHEITHGFDSQGRTFDANGNAKDWWSYSSEQNFETKADCLVNQYNNYEVFGEYINGQQTLNENIADNGGIKLAYDAYQSWVDDNKKEGRLPNLDLSVDQLFFIGFATGAWSAIQL
ncbi:endothelin-converting enzyme 1-like isoform X3 [Orbicella faveolata]|uniref:endothelin-converting enzyme 1-like isoform X3 n=1 Tax=Orbicella faveolata TaxID=48498 RepID=UPI0009E64EF3|nr:endothelin-converting enzyme 1-like isoform X3 [Orbicella faveolata]